MVEPVATGALVVGAVGAGAWLADKIFGPSADALGKELQTYGSKRLNAIFSRTQAKLSPEEVTPVPPGFALQLMQKASFSEDDDVLTEAWANLLANASRKFESRYSLFVEILSLMTASDALFFANLFDKNLDPDGVENVERLSGFMTENYSSVSGQFEFVGTMIDQIRSVPIGFHGAVRKISMPYSVEGPEHRYADHVEVWHHERDAEIDALVRNGLLREFSVNLDHPYHKPGLEGVIVTALGEKFYMACGGNL